MTSRGVDERHTGENIANLLFDIQKVFCIKEVLVFATDNASYNEAAARLTGYVLRHFLNVATKVADRTNRGRLYQREEAQE